MRSGLREAATGLAPDPRGLLPALVVGDTRNLPPDLVTDLRSSGLAHLTAVSGANVAIVVTAAVLLARWGGVRGAAVPLLAIVSTAGFVLLARPDPSVLRAAVMGTVAVLAVAVGGRRPGQAALFATVIGLLLVDPWLARSWGFALSVAATAGLLLLAPRWRERWSRRLPPPLAEAAAVAWAAQVATLPLSVALSGRVSLVAVPANVLAAPAVPPATVLGAAAAVISPVAPGPAHWLVWVAGLPTGWICAVARRASAWPMASVPWPDGALGTALVVAALGGVALAVTVLRRAPRSVRFVAALAAVALVAAALSGPLRWPPPGWLIVACDVGQGDGLVVAAGDGEAVVVDAGPDPVVMDRCLDQLGVRRIPLLVLTHDHADHVMGLPGALGGRPVGEVLTSPLAEPEEQATAVARWTSDANVSVVTAQVGMHGVVGEVTWDVLAPERIIRGQGSDPNNASVVLLVAVRGVRVLLTGDVEPAAQAALLASGTDLSADVLKVPHHGSVYQDPGLVDAVDPALALISVGADNPYGHPAPELIAGLAAGGVVVARTDTDGDIAVALTAHGLRVVTRRRRGIRGAQLGGRGLLGPAGRSPA
jgi:competence protein ComEC